MEFAYAVGRALKSILDTRYFPGDSQSKACSQTGGGGGGGGGAGRGGGGASDISSALDFSANILCSIGLSVFTRASQ